MSQGPLQDSKVTLNFNATDSRNSKLELIHDGLFNEEEQRTSWMGESDHGAFSNVELVECVIEAKIKYVMRGDTTLAAI